MHLDKVKPHSKSVLPTDIHSILTLIYQRGNVLRLKKLKTHHVQVKKIKQ